MPIKFKNVSNASSGVGTYSVSLNGTNQYLTVPASTNWAFGTGSFTVEWFQYMTAQNSNPRVFAVGNYSTTSVGVSIEGGTFYVWEASGYRLSYSLTSGGYLNRWIHFAISRNNGTTRVFKDGTQIGSSYADTYNISNSGSVLAIGQESNPTNGSYFTGYISNFRIIKGDGIYTGSFTVPTSPLTAIANTQLLTCQSSTIIDNSPNNYTITNSGSATVSSAIVPFSASPAPAKIKYKNRSNNTRTSNIKLIVPNPSGVVSSGLTMNLNPNNASSYNGSGTTWYDISGNSANITLVNSPTYTSGTPSYFTFNGTTQYGTGATTNLLPQTAYTKNVWVYLNAYGDNNMISSDTGGHFLYMAASNRVYSGHANWGNYGAYGSTGTLSLNTWYNIALTFSTTNGMALYINGTLDSTYTANKAAHAGNGSTNIGTFSGGNLMNGRIGQALCYNRELSGAEIAQNYNYTKATYGL